MRLSLAVIIILSFAALAIFGFLAMGQNPSGYLHNCLAATAQQTSCPEHNPLASVVFHLNFFRFVTTATLKSIVGIVLLTWFFGFGFLLLLFQRRETQRQKNFIFSGQLTAHFQQSEFLSNKELDWLALHEKRDPAAAA